MPLMTQNLKNLQRKTKKTILPLLLPHVLKLRINTYAPYIGAGIKVEHINLDKSLCVVSMGLNPLNKNIVGTQFGGSLYSMVDPFYMLLLMHQLGSSYVVWDKSSHIDFVAPGNSKVTARMQIPHTEIVTIKELAKDGEAVFREYEVEIIDEQQNLVATVTKTIYIRLRQYSNSKDQTIRIDTND